MLEWRLIAKKERLIGRHRFDHRGQERGIATGFERQHQLAQAVESRLPGERKETTFQEIVLVGTQREAGALFQDLPEKIVIRRRHDQSPASSRYRARQGLPTG